MINPKQLKQLFDLGYQIYRTDRQQVYCQKPGGSLTYHQITGSSYGPEILYSPIDNLLSVCRRGADTFRPTQGRKWDV